MPHDESPLTVALLPLPPERKPSQFSERKGSKLRAWEPRIKGRGVMLIHTLEKMYAGNLVAAKIRNALLVVQSYLLYAMAVI